MKKISLFLFLALIISSCTLSEQHETERRYEANDDGSYTISVTVEEPEVICATKSSFTQEELSRISDLNILIYHNGQLLKGYSRYFSDLSNLAISFPSNKDIFNVYMVGNVGEVEAPEDESEISKLQYVVGSYDEFRTKGFPVANTFMNYQKGSQVEFKVKKLVGQYNIRIDASATEATYTVKDLRMMNCALDVYPFSDNTPAKVFGKMDSTNAGDMLTEDDIAKLNAGETVTLFFIENLQGVLLPNNTDRKKKIPSEINKVNNGVSDRCTYIEVTADVQTPAATYTNGKYRFYLGQDETTDFNIRRNTLYNATLDFTQNMVSEEEWRIEVGEPKVHEIKCSLEDEAIVVFRDCEDYTTNRSIHSYYSNATHSSVKVYLYCETEDIRKILPQKRLEAGTSIYYDQSYRAELIINDSNPLEFGIYYDYFVDNNYPSYKGHVAIPVRISWDKIGNNWHSLEDEDDKFNSYDIRIYSTEKYNGKPIFDKTYKDAVKYTEQIYPLLFKIEKDNEENSYYLTVRGVNPAQLSLNFDCTLWYDGNQIVLPQITTSDIKRNGTRLHKLVDLVDVNKLSKIELNVTYDYITYKHSQGEGKIQSPVGTCASTIKIGPYDNFFPYNVNYTDNTRITFYRYLPHYNYWSWDPINGDYTESVTLKTLIHLGYEDVIYDYDDYCRYLQGQNISGTIFKLDDYRKELSEDSSHGLHSFYFLNGCMMSKELIITPRPAGNLESGATWRGFNWYFYGPGRDLFDDPNIRSQISDHSVNFVITHWYTLFNKYRTKLQSKNYSGAAYLTINGFNYWEGGDTSEDGYILE